MKQIVIKESYPNKDFTGESVSIRTLTAPTYQELFKTIDKEDHELLIYKVKSNNDNYNNGFFNIASAILITAQATLLTYMYGGISPDDPTNILIKKILEIAVYLVKNAAIISAIYLIIKGILDIIKNKEVSLEGSKFVATNYPNEYSKINAPKSLKKIMRTKKEEEI